MSALYWILLIFGGFILGSIPFCVLIPKLFLNMDICEVSDDKNPGGRNVFKYCGAKMGISCIVLDILKGAITTTIGSVLIYLKLLPNNIGFSFTLLAPVAGHAIGIFNHFHGGKSISTSFGSMIGLVWLLPYGGIGLGTLIFLFLFFIMFFIFVLKINSFSKCSLLVYSLFSLITLLVFEVLKMPYEAIGCVFVGLVPIVKFSWSFYKKIYS